MAPSRTTRHFNEQFGVSAIEMQRLGVFNAEIGVDNRMFVDPKLLEDAQEEFAAAHAELIAYFEVVANLVRLIKKQGDLVWAAACKRMQFKETANTALGFAKEGIDGNGIGETLSKQIIARALEILPQVEFAPDLFELIGVFAERIGCDRLSDMIVAILKPRFLAYTCRATKALGIRQTIEVSYRGVKYTCPSMGKTRKPLILVPQHLLKPLPIAANIEDALDIADLNDEARNEVNRIYAEASRARVSPKPYLRGIVRRNPAIARGIIEGYRKAPPVPYDYDQDPNQVAGFNPIAREIVGELPKKPTGLSAIELVERCVFDTITQLQKSIEHNRLADLLYDDAGRPRREIASQRLIYAIADIFAKIYGVDLSREANAGPGAVDFRFTVGRDARLLVEVKLSTHKRLQDGYYEQLPAYAKAENITRMILLVVRISEDDSHLNKLTEAVKRYALPIQIVVINAVRRPPASKRSSQSPE